MRRPSVAASRGPKPQASHDRYPAGPPNRMKPAVPAWLGWPGGPNPPGSGWVPGSLLRMAILGLACAFLALSLTVNYAASVSFFLLAIAGMYIGFRRGFVAGLTRAERLVMLAFVAYPAIAILSYMLGAQTNLGFRFLGRDLHFLLFIPVYLAIRWSRPRAEHLGYAFAGGAVAACILALLQGHPSFSAWPHGIAGSHIVFGDLSLLTGFLALVLLVGVERHGASATSVSIRYTAALIGVAAGFVASVLSDARGGWPVIVLYCVFFLWHLLFRLRRRKFLRPMIVVLVLAIIVGCFWAVPFTRRAINVTMEGFSTFAIVSRSEIVNSSCVDRKGFLHALLDQSTFGGSGRIGIVMLDARERRSIARLGCIGSYALSLRAGKDQKPLWVSLYRGNWALPYRYRRAGVIVMGRARFRLGYNSHWIEIESLDSWKKYTSANASAWTNPANIVVMPGQHAFVIPLQIPAGVYALALAHTSLGQRIVMWNSAWNLFKLHPYLGVGTGGFRAFASAGVENSSLAHVVGHYEHAHSDYMTSLATSGAIGLLSYLFVLLAPFYSLVRVSRTNPGSHFIGPGAVLLIGLVVFGLTETMFVHSLVIEWYVIAVAILLACACTAMGKGHSAEEGSLNV